MDIVDWLKFEANCKEDLKLSFERFNFLIVHKKFNMYGNLQYFYNTPGSEFYLELTKDCGELNAKKGQVIGWQVKWWLNRKDGNNSPLNSAHKNELVEGFKKSLEYKKNITTWIICTPGQTSNSSPHFVTDKLIGELQGFKKDTNILFWNKEFYLAIYHEDPIKYSSIFPQYFANNYIDMRIINNFTKDNLNILKNKYDIDVHVVKNEEEIELKIYMEKLQVLLKQKIKIIKDMICDYKKSSKEVFRFSYYRKEYLNALSISKRLLIDFFEKTIDIYYLFEKDSSIIKVVKEIAQQIEERAEEINKYLRIKHNMENNYHEKKENAQYNYEESTIVDEYKEHIKVMLDTFSSFNIIIDSALRREVHVFGKAGNGKTCLAASICEKMVLKEKPVLLLLGSSFRSNGESIRKQILDKLSINITFDEFIGSLDNMGFIGIVVYTTIPSIIR